MGNAIRIGVIGDFEPVRWIPTSALDSAGAPKILSRWDGLIASPGSPYQSFSGMLRGIEFARTEDWPFTGT